MARNADDSPQDLGQTLIHLAQAFIALGEEIAALGGVTPQQWAVLHLVGAAGDAALAPSELAAASGTSRANVTKLVARLGRLGFVATLPSPSDGRQKRLVLTAAGDRALSRMNAEKASRLAHTLEAFSPADQAALGRLAGTLLRELARDRTPTASARPAPGGRPRPRRA